MKNSDSETFVHQTTDVLTQRFGPLCKRQEVNNHIYIVIVMRLSKDPFVLACNLREEEEITYKLINISTKFDNPLESGFSY